MKAAQVQAGRVVNVAVFPDGAELPAGWQELETGMAPGATWDGEQWQPPAPVATERRIPTAEFIERFTGDEFAAIEAAAASNGRLRQLYKVAEVQGTVNLESDKLAQALADLEAAGILAEGRAAEIAGA